MTLSVLFPLLLIFKAMNPKAAVAVASARTGSINPARSLRLA